MAGDSNHGINRWRSGDFHYLISDEANNLEQEAFAPMSLHDTPTHDMRTFGSPITTTLINALDNVTDLGDQKDSIYSLLRMLWHGDSFDRASPEACEKAGERFERNLQLVQTIREQYAPPHVAQPVDRGHRFRSEHGFVGLDARRSPAGP